MTQFFLYLDRDTWVHHLDPRTKVLGVLALFALALMFSDPWLLLPLAGFIAWLLTVAGAWRNVQRLWMLLALLFVYCLLLWPFFVQGRTPWLAVGSHLLTVEAVQYGLAMGLRLDLMLLAGLLLLSTTTIEEFTLALQRLGLPATMGFALALAFRWVPSLIGSAGQIVQAQRSRGLDLRGGHLLARVRRYVPLIIPLIGHSLRQTQMLAMALESKGYGPGIRRQPYLVLRFRPADYVVLGLLLGLLLVGWWLRLRGYGTVPVSF
ncbi:MAG: energy-coupling factor transporter transmembrane component T family protein [Nitrospirales bacterium]